MSAFNLSNNQLKTSQLYLINFNNYTQKTDFNSAINSYFQPMADVHSRAIRSYNMSQIKGTNTKPEILVRKFLFSKGFRFRLHDKKLPGKPDIILPKYKSLIFVNGCFWHGHDNCRYFIVPKTRSEWWLNKIQGNKQRDIENIKKLTAEGWKILTIFECELKTDLREKTFNRIIKFLK